MFKGLMPLVNRSATTKLTVVQIITNLIAPPVCCLCRGTGQALREPWGLDLCVHCDAACERPAHNVEPGVAPVDSIVSALVYSDPVDQMIAGLKFHHDLVFARVLGMLFVRERLRLDLPLPECIVPLPLHDQRYRERGFNQALEIARHIAPRLQLPINTQLLRRHRSTSAQSELEAEQRAHNVADAFRANRDRQMPRHVALLDDVVTTGHTVAAAAKALKAAGCRRVEVWACARALKDRGS
jgi:ComF family protein